jgi:SAM-dependent methyltransferase
MNTITEHVREKYGAIAKNIREGKKDEGGGCCGGSCGTGSRAGAKDQITSDLYSESEKVLLPAEAVAASLGCGNPTALTDLREGERVLDLGSGGGIDVLLSARRVGPTGKAYGLDMTDEMLALARENQRKAGATNVEFLKGTIEAMPLPDSAVDVVISNCVINLSADKDQVLAEAFRVLAPGGRFAVSDVVSLTPVSEAVRGDLQLWSDCVAGALEVNEYRAKLEAAGFVNVDLEIYREYDDMAGQFASAFIRGQKPDRAVLGAS